MRLKNSDGPLSVYSTNGNDDLNALNSPKRINTLQNSNIISNYNTALLNGLRNAGNDVRRVTTGGDGNVNFIIDDNNEATLNNINSTTIGVGQLQWCNAVVGENNRLLGNVTTTTTAKLSTTDFTITEELNNTNNTLYNINNTLAVALQRKRPGTASSIYSESSPDDSLLEYEGKIILNKLLHKSS